MRKQRKEEVEIQARFFVILEAVGVKSTVDPPSRQ